MLGEITIPASVRQIAAGVFNGCPALYRIQVENDNKFYDSREDCNAIIHTGSNILIAGCRNSRIPETVEQIGSYAFYRINGLRSITIPDSTLRICDAAFSECVDLEEVYFGKGLTYIDFGAFYRCTSLKKINLPNGLREIGTWAFAGCKNLEEPVGIPGSVTHIGTAAFAI